MFKDYYKFLGIATNATQEEIKKAYRSQSMRWHPDKNPGVDTTAQMQNINEAYNILKDATTKARYDAEYARFNFTKFGQPGTTKKEEPEYDIKDETLKDDIKEAQKAAEDYVREFYASLKKDSKKAVRGAWDEMKGYVIFSLILSFIVMVAMTRSGCQSPAERLAELNSKDYSTVLTENLDRPSDPPVPRKEGSMATFSVETKLNT